MGFIPWHEQGWHYTYGFGFGGDFYDEANCQVTPTDENIVAAFEWAYDHAAAKGPQQLQAFRQLFSRPDLPPQQNPFIAGQLAMVLTGDWMIGNLERYVPDLNYGVTYIPVPEAGPDFGNLGRRLRFGDSYRRERARSCLRVYEIYDR